MNGLFQIDDSLANKISYYHLMLLMASLPFDRFYSHLILISLFIHTLIHLKKGKIKPLFTWKIAALSSVFLITVFSTFYSINRSEAFTEWGKQVPILLFPLLFCLNPLDVAKYKWKLLGAFTLICTATTIYLYADAWLTIRHYQLPLKAMFSSAFTNHNFSEPIKMHATFFSMQIAIGLIYSLTVLLKRGSSANKVLYLICFTILSAGLIQLSSKSVFAALLIVINIAVPYFMLKGAWRWKYILIASILSIGIVAAILHSGALRERFVNELKIDLKKNTANETTDGRLARWGVVTELIKNKPIIGYGAGSEMMLLQDAFFSHKLYNSYLNRLNSHSEYLSFMLKSGIVGLLAYLLTLAFGFTIAFRKKDLLFFSFMLLVAVVSFSENLLDVDKGIFYYAFFFSFFVFGNEVKKVKGMDSVIKKQTSLPIENNLSRLNEKAVLLN